MQLCLCDELTKKTIELEVYFFLEVNNQCNFTVSRCHKYSLTSAPITIGWRASKQVGLNEFSGSVPVTALMWWVPTEQNRQWNDVERNNKQFVIEFANIESILSCLSMSFE